MTEPATNVFVLCTGRCGSVTFARACEHFTNFSVGHESRSKIGSLARVDYPQRHIEVDNRLASFLGMLEARYGDNAFYVHLKRDRDQVAHSLNRRWHMRGFIVRGFVDQILAAPVRNPLDACYQYIETVETNISAFLRDKSNTMNFNLQDYAAQFPEFSDRIAATGGLEEAMSEWKTKHNQSP